MKTLSRQIPIFMLMLATFGIARAGCSSTSQPDAPLNPRATAHTMTTVFQPTASSGPRLLAVGDWNEHADIVGLWKFEMLAKSTSTNANPMPDGALIDFGTAAWHVDGTELLNSGIRNPADGNFCQGVWAQTGPSTFKLNHYALSYMNGVYAGPANIRMRVTLDRSGQSYSGTFTLVQYLAPALQGHEFDQTTPLVSITGTITGTRITP
jgi:hypothetical protein